MKQENIIIVFAKNLIPGQVKTRLAASIGRNQAFMVYKNLVAHTYSVVEQLPYDKIVYYSEFIDKDDIWIGEFFKKKQTGNDLGKRMMNAFTYVFQQGYSKAVIIGTDCPSINVAIITNAFSQLDQQDVAIGPASDGGYYLLGMKELHRQLFQNVQWSTEKVLETTIATCNDLHLSYSLLPELHDIDDEKDLVHLKSEQS